MSRNELIVKRNNPYLSSKWVYIVRNDIRVESFGFTTFKLSAQVIGKVQLWYANWEQNRWERMP